MISIIIPVYNLEFVVENAIKSVLNQTFNDWEIILVDDGSTDHSPGVCDYYAATDSRISVVHKSNGGLSSARNAGINIAQGEYIMLLDGDDYIHPNTMEILQQTMNQYPQLDFLQFRYKEVNEYQTNETFRQMTVINNIRIVSSEEKMFQILYDWGGMAASACTKIYKKELFNSLEFKEGILHEDEEFTTHLLSSVHHAGYCDNVFYIYVMRPSSIIHSEFSPNKMWSISVLEERIEYLKGRNFNHLVKLNTAKLFYILCRLHCEVSTTGYLKEKIIIEKKVAQLSRTRDLPIQGLISLIYHSGLLSVFALRTYSKLKNLYVHSKKNS